MSNSLSLTQWQDSKYKTEVQKIWITLVLYNEKKIFWVFSDMYI